MMKTITSEDCIDCGSSHVRAAFLRSPKDNNVVTPISEPAFWTDDGYVILKCDDCGSIFLNPHYFEESFAVYDTERYFTGYFPNNIHRGGGPELIVPSKGLRGRRAIRNAQKRARTLLRLAGISPESHPRVLEIGCAQGRLVQALTAIGCDACGVDVSETSTSIASKNGLEVYRGRVEDVSLPDQAFDLIFSIQTFEHMADLGPALQAARNKLKPDGALLVAVPNDVDGYRGKIYLRKWWMIPPMHIRYFTRASAKSIFGRHGLSVDSFSTEGSLGTDMRMIAEWLLKKAKLSKLPLWGKAWAIMSRLMLPFDGLLNIAGMHSELVVVVKRADLEDSLKTRNTV
jgi:SAM-dependent methyltransferase